VFQEGQKCKHRKFIDEKRIYISNKVTRRWLSSGLQRRLDWYEFTDISEVCTASIIAVTVIALMTEAVQTYKTLVNSYQSKRRCNTQDSHLQTRCHQNLKSYSIKLFICTLYLSCSVVCHVTLRYSTLFSPTLFGIRSLSRPHMCVICAEPLNKIRGSKHVYCWNSIAKQTANQSLVSAADWQLSIDAWVSRL
jgi:hypothetical protein